MWECGLKRFELGAMPVRPCHSLCGSVDWNIPRNCRRIEPGSLLMWECGLKREIASYCSLSTGSLLMWECGLKHLKAIAELHLFRVTPYVGVWIETLNMVWTSSRLSVTPYVGVWIETASTLLTLLVSGSHSLCGSVDWNRTEYWYGWHQDVTPYVGVWIETKGITVLNGIANVTPYVGVWIETRHPLQLLSLPVSLLMWECGLKPAWQPPRAWKYNVTPYVGVWIETYNDGRSC